jgi:hypothetical protein
LFGWGSGVSEMAFFRPASSANLYCSIEVGPRDFFSTRLMAVPLIETLENTFTLLLMVYTPGVVETTTMPWSLAF